MVYKQGHSRQHKLQFETTDAITKFVKILKLNPDIHKEAKLQTRFKFTNDTVSTNVRDFFHILPCYKVFILSLMLLIPLLCLSSFVLSQ